MENSSCTTEQFNCAVAYVLNVLTNLIVSQITVHNAITQLEEIGAMDTKVRWTFKYR